MSQEQASWSAHAAHMAYVVMAGMVAFNLYLHNRAEIDKAVSEAWWTFKARLTSARINLPRNSIERQVREHLREPSDLSSS